MVRLPWEVRPAFLKHFATDVLLETPGGNFGPIKGIFDAEPTGGPSNFPGTDDSSPEVLLDDADVPSTLTIKSVAIIDGTRYRVSSIRPDGTGFTLVKLVVTSSR